jgi:hypothetical protein
MVMNPYREIASVPKDYDHTKSYLRIYFGHLYFSNYDHSSFRAGVIARFKNKIPNCPTGIRYPQSWWDGYISANYVIYTSNWPYSLVNNRILSDLPEEG